MDTAKINKSSSRRSSILKSAKARHPLQNINFNTSCDETSPITTTKLKRRVSFAEKKHIKEFCNSLEQGTVWDNTYEEHDLSNNKILCASNQGVCSIENIPKENLQANEFPEVPNLIHSEISQSIPHECDTNVVESTSNDKDQEDGNYDLDITNPVESIGHMCIAENQEDKNVQNYDLDITNPVESIGYTCIEKNQEEISVKSSNVLDDPRIQEDEDISPAEVRDSYSFSSKKIVVFEDEDENVPMTSGQHSTSNVNNFNHNTFNETCIQDASMEFTAIIGNNLRHPKISVNDENAVYHDSPISQSLANMEFEEINELQKNNSSMTEPNEDIIQNTSMEFTKAISSIIKSNQNLADSAVANCLIMKNDRTTIFNNVSMEITAAVPLISNRCSDSDKLQQMQSEIIDKENCNFIGIPYMASDTIVPYDDELMEMTTAVETNTNVDHQEDNVYREIKLDGARTIQSQIQARDKFASTEERTKLLDVSMEMTRAVRTNTHAVHEEDNRYKDMILDRTKTIQSRIQGTDEFASTEERTKLLDTSMEMTRAVRTGTDEVHQEGNRHQHIILDRTRTIQSQIQARDKFASTEERTKLLDVSMEMTRAVRMNTHAVHEEDNRYKDMILDRTKTIQSRIQGTDEFASTEERTKLLDTSMEMTRAVRTGTDEVHQEGNRHEDIILDRTRTIQSQIQARDKFASMEERTKLLDVSMEMTRAVRTNTHAVHQEDNRYQDIILDRTKTIQSRIQGTDELASTEEKTKLLNSSMEMTQAVRTDTDEVHQEGNRHQDIILDRTRTIQSRTQGRDEFVSTEERTKLLDVSMEMTRAVRTNSHAVHQEDNRYQDIILDRTKTIHSRVQSTDELASAEERTKLLDASMEMTRAVRTDTDEVHQEGNRHQDIILDRTRRIQSQTQGRDDFVSTEEGTKLLDVSMEMTRAVRTDTDKVHQEGSRHQDIILDRTRTIQSQTQGRDEFVSTEERTKLLNASIELTKACSVKEDDLEPCKYIVNPDNRDVYSDEAMDLSEESTPTPMHHSVKEQNNLPTENTTSRAQDLGNVELNNCRNSNVINMEISHCTTNVLEHMLITNSSMINAEDSNKRKTVVCNLAETQRELNNKAVLLLDTSIENIVSMQGSPDRSALTKPETDSSNDRQSNFYSVPAIEECGSKRNSLIKEHLLNNTQTSSNCKADIPLHERVEQNTYASASKAPNERKACLTTITEIASCTATSTHTNTSAHCISSITPSDINLVEHQSQHDHSQNNRSIMKTFTEHLTDETGATKKPDGTAALTENSTLISNAIEDIKTTSLREEDYGHCISNTGALDVTNSNEEHLEYMSSTYHNNAVEELESIKPPSFINFDESKICVDASTNSIISNQDLQEGINEVSLTELKELSRNSSKIIEESNQITSVCKSISNTTCNHPNPNLIYEHQSLKEDATSKSETFEKCNNQDVVNNFTTDREDQVHVTDAVESQVNDMDDTSTENRELECSLSEDDMTEPILQHSFDSPEILDHSTHSITVQDQNSQYLLRKTDISKRNLSNTDEDRFPNTETVGLNANASNEIAANSETLDCKQILSDIELRKYMECSKKFEEKDSSIVQSNFSSVMAQLKIHVQSDDIIWDIYYKNIERKIIAISFMSSSLLLIIFLMDDRDSDNNQFVKKIKFISRLTDDADTLIHIVHRLILEKIDTEKLLQLYKNYNDILSMLNYISEEVKLSMDFMFDLKRLDDLHLMEIFRDRISFIMRTERMDIVLKVTINIKPFNQIKPHDIIVDCLLGSVREEDVTNLITNIKRDHKFLRRYMGDVRHYIYLMEESNSLT